MNLSRVRQQIKPWIMPMAMVAGLLFHNFMDKIAFLAPYLIFVMLLITFCRVKFENVRITKFSWSLLAVQVLGALMCYFAILPFDEVIAQGVFICIFCPTATAAPVITGMLGGDIVRLITYSLISNTVVAILSPFLFAMMSQADISIISSTLIIAKRVVPLIIAPLIVAMILRRVTPRVHKVIAEHQSLSFYIWALSLFIVVGRAVSFILKEPAGCIPQMIALALFSLVACLAQFGIGRRIGRACGDKVAGTQGLGQKNTVLAIWMALTYLHPLSSVAPAAYVAWQNTINSLQLYFKAKRDSR
jgi:BASS family bile acid:Na+ symporter